MTRTFVPVLVFGVELVVQIDQVVIQIVVEIVVIIVVVEVVIVLVEIVLVVEVVIIFVIQIVFIVEELVLVIFVIIEIFVIEDLVLRIVTVSRTCPYVARVYSVPHPRVALFSGFLSRRLESVQHTITFLRVREAPARVSLRVTASFDRSRCGSVFAGGWPAA